MVATAPCCKNTHGVCVCQLLCAYQWITITNNATAFTSLDLWFALYDGIKSLQFSSPFGGWTSPVMKQYSSATPLCGAIVDMDWN